MNKQQLLKFIKENDLDIQNAKASIFIADMVFGSYVEFRDIPGVRCSPILGYHKGTDFFQISAYNQIKDIAKKNYEQFIKNTNKFSDKLKKYREVEKDIDSLWKKYNDTISDKQLFELFKKITKLARKWWHYSLLAEDKGKVIEHEVVPIIQKNHNLSRTEAEEIVSLLSHPDEQALFNKERKEFFNICIYVLSKKGSMKEDRTFMRKFSDYHRKYFYKYSDFYSHRDLTPESLLKEIKQETSRHSAAEIRKEIKHMDEETRKLHNKKQQLLKKIRLSPVEKKNIAFASKLIVLHDERKIAMMKQFYYIFTLIHEIAGRFNLTYGEISSLTYEEFIDFISGNMGFDRQEIHRRIDETITINETGKKTRLFYGKDARELFDAARKISEEQKEIKGMIGSRIRGKEIIRGIARIIKDPKNTDFKQGEILVTSMTRIEFVPIMKRSLAIVTDEGGVACHAAIVSRELGIPCVIGTRTATAMIKDGDEIEVDTEKGIVKKLK